MSGCSIIKFGQWLSMRPDIIPPDVIEALSKLRDSTSEHSIGHTRAMIKKSFGRSIDDLFEEFEEKPIASASVGQVHRARLRQRYALEGNCRDVVVKVRHPQVLDETFVDTTIIFAFVNVVPFFDNAIHEG